MIDLALAGAWLLVLLAGIGIVVALHARGVRSTYVRDLLHIGAGIWVLGWPCWKGWLAPSALAAVGAAATAAAPALARNNRWAKRFVSSVTSGDERYAGLVHYTLAFALLTPIAVLWRPFPAAAALLALAWGDGPGGAIGRRFGRHRFRWAGAKTKSIEGSIVVAVGAALGAFVAASLFGVAATDMTMRTAVALGLGVIAALAEGLSPRGLDNAIVPATVFAVAALATLAGMLS